MTRPMLLTPVSLRRLCILASALTLLALSATVQAADSQRVPLAQGNLSAPKASWKAIAVPPGSILIDLFDARGATITTYAKSFSPLAPRAIDASGFRPPELPSRHALVAGATGSQIRKVKISFKDGSVRTLRTVAAHPEWKSPNRYFAYGATVPASKKNVMVVISRIDGLNARGKTIATLRHLITGAY